MATLLVLVTFFSIHQYQNHLYITNTYKEYYIRQSLFEVGHQKLLEKMRHDQDLEKTYQFKTPHGTAIADCNKELDIYKCEWNIEDRNGGTKTVTVFYE